MDGDEEWFVSAETGTAFRHCVRCALPLLELDSSWLVNKEYHRGECVLEYAVCGPCRDEMAGGFSEESKRVVRDFFEKGVNWDKRLSEFMMMADPVERLSGCVVCERERRDCEGFAVSAMFDAGGNLVEGALPLMVCHDCAGEVMGRLSKETKDAWRRFVDECLPGPPRDETGLPGDPFSGWPGIF